MGRAKGKGKKQSSGEDEKLPVKRRGRPTKAPKEDATAEEDPKTIETEKDDVQRQLQDKEVGSQSPLESGKKRKQPEEDLDPTKNENGHEPPKSVGFRHIGSRRKNKPRRAAEVGVSAYEVCGWLLLSS